MSHLFSTLEPIDRHQIARLLARCPRVALRAGDVRAHDDVPNASLLLVEEGILVVASAPRATRRMVLALAVDGGVLAPPRPGEQLTALADSALIAITADARRALLEVAAAAEAIFGALVSALWERQESLAQFANVAHAERLREKLVQLARLHGRVVPEGVRVDLPLTHELLGQSVGSARETVTSAIGALEREGFLVRNGRSYLLAVSPASLAT